MENNDFGPVIFSYTRKQAIEDGVLTDITEIAKQAGFKYPVAISTGVLSLVNDGVKVGRDYNGIVWDILNVLKVAARKTGGSRADFKVLIWNGKKDIPHDLYSICGPGDDRAPVVTIMLPDED